MPSEVADVMLPNAQSTPWPKEDARDARDAWGALPVRPALAAVLGALTTEPEAWWREKIAAASRRDAVRVWSDSVDVFVPRPSGRPGTTHQRLWSFDDPDEASEVLLARGLLPARWCGDARRGWWCAACKGAGIVREYNFENVDCACAHFVEDEWVRGFTAGPRTIADLVVVASLGVPALLRAETLARDAYAALREYGCPQPERVVWRVGERRETKDRVLAHAWVSGSAEQILSCEGRWYAGSTRDGIVIRKRSWAGDVGAACALWKMGLALDAITADAVRIVVPPVGGVQ